MANQVLSSVENNFTKGLITEFTGLNFPENAATDTSNCLYSIVGDVTRREGFDYEASFSTNTVDRTNKAISDYKWNNVGGDGNTQIVVTQVGGTLYFYRSSTATITAPLSTQKLASTVNLSSFLVAGSSADLTVTECQYSDGNGYLFVYHPNLNPFYCSYSSGTITANAIDIKIRDFSGINESSVVTTRPATLSNEHLYNLINQGWTQGAAWGATSTTAVTPAVSSIVFTVAAGLAVTIGDNVNISNNVLIHSPYSGGGTIDIPAGTIIMTGNVTAYSGTNLTVNVYSVYPPATDPFVQTFILTFYNTIGGVWIITPNNIGFISTWFTAVSNYPSNADVWWYYKDSTGSFNPAVTFTRVTLNAGPAPKGHFVISAFDQQRSLLSGVPSITPVTTTVRPQTGCWFQGRVWYAGVNASQVPTGDAGYYTWTENIYFSQVVVDTTQFGACYQTNDPTSETLFGELPTDGGVIQIQGCGSIYKLFPVQNALLVFAANGVWYVTGSQGIGFTANDYTVVKLSSVRSISGTSFVDVQGLPMFWNEEGIYTVEAAKQGPSLTGNPLHVNPLEVNPITVGTILTYYNSIPLQSKKYVRGDYNPIDYVVQWTFRSTNETTITSRYQFNTVLNYNNYNKAFFPYTLPSATNPYIHGVRYVASPGGSSAAEASFKYFCSNLVNSSYVLTFAEERDDTFVDWFTNDKVGINYKSFFVTGYKVHGQGQRRFQVPYIYMFSRGSPVSYKIQGIWDYALSGDSGKWSTAQLTNIWNPNFGINSRRHKIRGQGLVLQIKVESTDKQPFDLIGWSTFETQNTSV